MIVACAMSSNAFLTPIDIRPLMVDPWRAHLPLLLRLGRSGRWRALSQDGWTDDVKLIRAWVSPGKRFAGLSFRSESDLALGALLFAGKPDEPGWRRLLVHLRFAR